MKHKISIILFSIITLLSGWIGHLIDQNLDEQPDEETLGMGLWLVLPLLTTIIIRIFTKDWAELGFKPYLKQNLKWYIVALIIYPIVTLLVVLLGTALGWIDTSPFNAPIYFAGFAAALLPNFIKNIFEEFVWRGYLTNKLIKLNLKDITIYLIVGGIWGAWHIPYYMHFLEDQVIQQILPVNRLVFSLIAIFTMTCWTVMYVELYRITQTIWPLVLLHMIEDSIVNHLILDKHIVIHHNAILTSPILGMFTSLLYLCIGLVLRKQRIQKNLK